MVRVAGGGEGPGPAAAQHALDRARAAEAAQPRPAA